MNKDFIEEIKQLEKSFSANGYQGCKEKEFEIKTGTIPILISAPHAVNHFRDGQVKSADVYTGGIGCYLYQVTNCHLMYLAKFSEADPNFDFPESNVYQQALKKYVDTHKIKVVLDLHGARKEREFAIEMGTAPEGDGAMYQEDPSLKGHAYITDAIRHIFENQFEKFEIEKEEIWKNKIFDAGSQNTITKFIYMNTEAVCVQLEINRIYREPENKEAFEALVEGLREIVLYLSNIHWEE